MLLERICVEGFPPNQIRSLSESTRNISLNALLEAQQI